MDIHKLIDNHIKRERIKAVVDYMRMARDYLHETEMHGNCEPELSYNDLLAIFVKFEKALECCVDAELGNCSKCPYDLNCIKNGTNLLAFDAHTLIKELQAKIEKLPYCVLLGNCEIYAPSHEEYAATVTSIYTTAITEFVNRINELIHEAELHGAYEPDIGCIIDDILKEMRIEL